MVSLLAVMSGYFAIALRDWRLSQSSKLISPRVTWSDTSVLSPSSAPK
jgi:hypothetical protein